MRQHAINRLEVLFTFLVQLLCLRLEFLETPFRIDEDSILGVLSQVEFLLERLRRLGILSAHDHPASR